MDERFGKVRQRGSKVFEKMVRFLVDNGQQKWVPYAWVDTIIRFLGYRLRLLEKIVSLWIKKRISYNKNS
jgi:hypothetical protein